MSEFSPPMAPYGPYTMYEPHERAGFPQLPDTRGRYPTRDYSLSTLLFSIAAIAVLLLGSYYAGRMMAEAEVATAADRAAKPVPIRGTIIGNHDGDTVTVAINVRLAEIDAPELRQEYGKESKAELSKLLPPKTLVNLLLDSVAPISAIDRYGRLIAYVEPAKPIAYGNVNRQMVIRGAAWQYLQYSKDPAYRQAEEFARNTSVGLWGADLPPLPPWEFRKRPVIKREVLPFPAPNPFKPLPITADDFRTFRPIPEPASRDTMPYDERHYDGGIRAGYHNSASDETPN